jgi:hypothetical protein
MQIFVILGCTNKYFKHWALDVSALTWLEKCVAIVVMIVGCATFAWSTATVTSIMCHQPISVVRFQKTMDMLDEFISVSIAKAKTSVYLIESFAGDHLKDN